MTNMSNLPRDLGKEYLDDQAKVEAKKGEFMMVMMMDFRVYLMRVNLHNDVESCIKREGELFSLGDEVDVSLSLSLRRVVVWNPYWGQTRWIEPTHDFHKLYSYALGYEKRSKSCRSYKILRFVDFFSYYVEFKIYDINSDSWRVLDISPYCQIHSDSRGVSVKRNTYWFVRNRRRFLVCFNFTRESFGRCLRLLFEFSTSYTVSLSSCSYTSQMQIWVTTKIEPNSVSWNSKIFLAVDMNPLTALSFQLEVGAASFFIDEEKKVAVVFDKGKKDLVSTHNIAYIVGVDGILEEVDLGISANKFCYPLVCSYVPSLVQL
ncbi:unnamed protein product [Arabidopsis lyrata]|uniref:F-box associated beta-propeller type 1 domain-containing protein n=2 Tax=Arabidopsis lyrata subsp. lyrata TaxID=81972 RepID=D7KAU8_ARALL|nr:hypothetical protein ARALYDRAFT_314206 [Arabidopsis lyrata subsp. lyrata]CAH8254802.1 unnamed protein product [Arabidopsis lyrata]